jgi:putative transposase
MARIARVVVPGIAHFITQRGNRQLTVFAGEDDYLHYIDLVAEGCRKTGTQILAYCLMPSQVQMIAVPPEKDSLRGAIADAHRRFARRVNARQAVTGHIWQDRFSSFPMDAVHTVIGARMVDRAPVAAGLVAAPQEYRWCSADAHLNARDDVLVRVRPLLDLVEGGAGAWQGLLAQPIPEAAAKAFALHETTGRPLGDRGFMERMEQLTGRVLAPAKRGPKPKVRV